MPSQIGCSSRERGRPRPSTVATLHQIIRYTRSRNSASISEKLRTSIGASCARPGSRGQRRQGDMAEQAAQLKGLDPLQAQHQRQFAAMMHIVREDAPERPLS